jgi:hypothetical protein
MLHRSIAPLVIGAAALLLPGIAAAQQTAVQAMQSINARAHFQIRQAELCHQPDDATRRDISAQILAWVSGEAARVGVDAAALESAAADGIAHADSRFGSTPSAEECATGVQQLSSFLADTVRQRNAAQKVFLGRHSRAHFQMRMAQLCRQPDEARQQEIASKLNDWLTANAAEAGVLPAALVKSAADATKAADAAYAQDASAKRCQQDVQSLITLSGG